MYCTLYSWKLEWPLENICNKSEFKKNNISPIIEYQKNCYRFDGNITIFFILWNEEFVLLFFMKFKQLSGIDLIFNPLNVCGGHMSICNTSL